MRQNKETDRAFYEVLRTIAVLIGTLILCIVAGILTSGCSPKVQYVPVESVTLRTDTIYSTKVRVDSVIFRDSVSLVQRGDTVFVTKYRDRYRVKERVDTVYQSMIDSVKVSVPYPVERQLSKWEQTKMDFGGMAIGGIVALGLAVVALAVWLIKIKRRR